MTDVRLLLVLLLSVLGPIQEPSTAQSIETEINKTGGALVYGITFDGDTASFRPGSEKVLQQIVVLMREHTDWRFEIQGHTAGPGGPEENLARSAERARAVTQWLVSHGVESERLVAKAYGDTRPVAAGSSEQTRILNSRVQLRKLNEE